LVSLGATSMPWMAESTLVSGSDMLAGVVCLKLLGSGYWRVSAEDRSELAASSREWDGTR
jgi:hypothetical protein